MKYLIGEIKYKIFDFLNKRVTDQLELRNNGFTVIENFLGPKECSNHITNIESLIRENQFSWADQKKSDVRIFGYENFTEEGNQIFDSLDKDYLSYISPFQPNTTLMANRTKYTPDNQGSGGGWHRDSLNRRQLKFMIYLTDVTKDNGAFEYLAGSHALHSKLFTNHFLYNKVRYTEKEIEEYTNKWKKHTLCGNQGTCMVFDSSGLHRGSPLLSGTRYAITKYIFDNEIPNHIAQQIIDINDK